MMDEKSIALRYLKSQKKRSVLLIIGVVLAIALISALFSILNIMQIYEVTSESENGIWHVMAQDCTSKQAGELARRVDVSDSGKVCYVQNSVVFNGKTAGEITGCDVNGAKQLNYYVISGKLPLNDNEIALEQWALDIIKPGAKVGDTIKIVLQGRTAKSYTVSGILKNKLANKQTESYKALVSLGEAQRLTHTDKATVLMQVRDGLNIDNFVKNIAKDENISKNLISQHTALLAAMGRSNSKTAVSIYMVGAFLALLVMFSAYMMIFNAFNISVTQRIRQFGMLRALGATPKQIRRIVKSEAVFVSLYGVLPGLITGIIVSNILLAFLRFVVPEYFTSDGPAFYISWVSLAIGAATGILATVVSSLLPAHKAGKVSPVEAMASADKKSIRKRTAKGISTKLIPVEGALSLRRLMLRKRSFVLISLSLSFGVLLLLAFSPVLDMLKEGTSQNFDLGDIYVASGSQNNGFSDNLINSISKVDGVETVCPKTDVTVNATFPYKLLGSEYNESIKTENWLKVKENSDGMVAAPSKSTIIGISDNDLSNLKSKLIFGSINPEQLNNENGVILALNFTGGLNITDLRPGSYIRVGNKNLKICAVIKTDMMMFVYNARTFVGMYTTHKVLNSINSASPNIITMTLKNGADSDMVYKRVKDLTKGIKGVQTGNKCETKDVCSRLTLVANVFIYGFIAVIALIGILNIINTMSTNILVRTREIGLLRAGGMTMGQVTAMIACEAVLYGILALIIGLGVGIPLEHKFFDMTVKQVYALPWSMPWNPVIISSAITIIAVMLSILSPLSYVKKIEITRAVTVE